MPQYFKEHGERLVELGYRILPLPPGSKGPRMKDWPQAHLSAADVRRMAANGSAQAGVGVIAATTPAIDVDILDPEVAERMSQEIDRIFTGQSLMTRTGRAPKFLIPFRSDEPFRKLSSGVYTDGKHDHHVEVLGDGQQWVAYHIHPATNKPYEWWNGLDAEGIVRLEADQLPVLTRIDAQRVIDAFEVLAADRVAAGLWSVRMAVVSAERTGSTDEDPFAGLTPPVGKTEAEVASLLKRHPNDGADYDHWFRVLCGVHHELGDAGRELAYEWSAASAKHSDEKFEKTWTSLGSYKGRMSTLRSVFAMVGKDNPASTAVAASDFVQAADFSSAQKTEWHIKHVIPKRGLIVVYGAPGSSKSFFVLDMVAHVARGLLWRGHKVQQSKIAYVAAEGVAGFGNRLAAYAKHNDVDLANLPVFVRGGSLLLNESTVGVMNSVNALGGVGLVVMDTLAAVTPVANENTSEDMGKAIESANLIVEGTGASVILIHHANKMGEMRGWSGLLAAADNTIRVEHEESTGLRAAHVEKQKEGRSDGKYGYRLRVVDLGHDADGDAITSCAVAPCESVAPNTRTEKRERKPRAGSFESSGTYRIARAYLQTIEDLIEASPKKELSMKDAIAGIQADPKHNQGLENHPDRSNVRKTLGSLADQGKVTLELGIIRLPDDVGDLG
jgi:hypothetical protein